MAIQEEYASVLSQRAESDLRACVTLAEDPEMADDVVGFHAQQAVEKVLEVVLVLEGSVSAHPRCRVPRFPRPRAEHGAPARGRTGAMAHAVGRRPSLRRAVACALAEHSPTLSSACAVPRLAHVADEPARMRKNILWARPRRFRELRLNGVRVLEE